MITAMEDTLPVFPQVYALPHQSRVQDWFCHNGVLPSSLRRALTFIFLFVTVIQTLTYCAADRVT